MFKNIILTGFMGVGKTSVGTQLAKDLGYAFVDTDELIEAGVAPEHGAGFGAASSNRLGLC